TRAIRFHFHPQSFARKGDGTFTPEKRWGDQRLRSRDCGDERASFRNRPTDSGNGSMFAGKPGVGYHPIGSGIGADRNRGEVVGVKLGHSERSRGIPLRKLKLTSAGFLASLGTRRWRFSFYIRRELGI